MASRRVVDARPVVGEKGESKHVVIVGGGFAGLAAARELGGRAGFRVTLVDRRNHHLFQPLLYQVATAALSPAEIAVPIRSIVRHHRNVEVRLGVVEQIDLEARQLRADFGKLDYDYLLLACGTGNNYFGHRQWEPHAPGLKSIEQALEIRRRVLEAFEVAERIEDREQQRRYLTFVVVGAGATGVEIAGALGEITRRTLARDFRNIDPKRARIILVEGAGRILASFDEPRADAAARALEAMGVSIWTNSRVSEIGPDGVTIGDERIAAHTVIWAAGIQASELGEQLGVERDRMGRVIVEADLSIPTERNVFVIGDQAHFEQDGEPLPPLAPVAIQQGRFAARAVIADQQNKDSERGSFRYVDKGIMATVGRAFAVVQTGSLRFSGFFAWLTWLFVHILYLVGFKNRLLVLLQWGWSYLTSRRGARLITERGWEDPQAPAIEARPKTAEKPEPQEPISGRGEES